MCGIFGAVTPLLNQHDLEEIRMAFQATASRGRDSSKLIGVSQQKIYPDPLTPPIVGMQRSWRFVGNNRAMPTTEWVDVQRPENIQPFISPSGRWIFTHNGTIANDRELVKEFATETPRTAIDSFVIGILLDHFSNTLSVGGYPAFIHTVQKLVGSFAILAIDSVSKNQGELCYATNYKPLYMLRDPQTKLVRVTSLASHLHENAEVSMRVGYAPIAIPQYTSGVIDSRSATVLNDLPIDYPLDKPLSVLRVPHGRVLAICSGGLDSTVAAWAHHIAGANVELLHFLYDCKAQAQEVKAVKAIAARMGTKAHFIELDFFRKFTKNSLTSEDIAINVSDDGERGAEYAHEWVPARNTVMLALATAFAEANGFDLLTLGNNLEESGGGFPDNEEEFINRFRHMLPYSVKPDYKLSISQPVGALVKHEIVKLGLDMNAPLELTWSCYSGGDKHCGTCGPCYLRKKAFAMNGQKDPVFL